VTKTGHNEYKCVTIIFYRLEKKFLRICLIILDAELPLGSLYIVQRVIGCLQGDLGDVRGVVSSSSNTIRVSMSRVSPANSPAGDDAVYRQRRHHGQLSRR